MASSGRATSPVRWIIQPLRAGGLTLAVAHLEVHVYLATTGTTGPPNVMEPAWLDTGAPFSVIPFHVHQNRLHWQPIPGIRATWAGQQCDLGRVNVWLPTDQAGFLNGPMSLLAKFPRSDPPGDPVPILLGLEFFLTHQAELQLFLPPRDGHILLP